MDFKDLESTDGDDVPKMILKAVAALDLASMCKVKGDEDAPLSDTMYWGIGYVESMKKWYAWYRDGEWEHPYFFIVGFREEAGVHEYLHLLYDLFREVIMPDLPGEYHTFSMN